MEIKSQGIVSMHKDVVTMLYTESKETILFYLLSLAGETEENLKVSLNLDEEKLQSILKYLSKKNLIVVEKASKALPKKTFMQKLTEECEQYLSDDHIDGHNLDRIARAKLIAYFYAGLTGKVFTTDTILPKLQNKQDDGTFQQIIESIWRNHHNEFCNGKGYDGKEGGWVWDISYLARKDTDKSQPLEKSLKRKLDVPVSDNAVAVLNKYVESIPALRYIKSIPCKYETIRDSGNEQSAEEILRKQREIKSSIGISIEGI